MNICQVLETILLDNTSEGHLRGKLFFPVFTRAFIHNINSVLIIPMNCYSYPRIIHTSV